ncbi:MAG: iron-sulfur cluster carrier protein ApbC [Pseudomonadota bacterium]|nr:iron-sulfur cluster carrier protein ApbC [Pseudomonadota bacterium]
MTSVTPSQVLDQLRQISGPDLVGNIVDQGLVSEILVDGTKVMFSIAVPSDQAQKLEPLRQAAEKLVLDMEGVTSALVVLTAEKKGGAGSGVAPSAGRPSPPPGRTPTGAPPPGAGQAMPQKAGVPGIGAIIAVASGKGGVGKSTTAVNLALGLKAIGLRVGMLDADIYGPSLPRLLGVKGKPEVASGRVLKPMQGHGLKVMSMGFLVDEDTPMIWRGPMVISALTQMLREVEWGDLDVLVVDMPPGTGDAQLTMAQQVPLAGAVIVSTPQDLALIDARKGLNMFNRVEVPVFGIVENMSTFICPHCGERSDIFGHGGAKAEAERIGVPFLGEVPLHMEIRRHSDEGTPVVVSEPDGVHAGIYREIAERIRQRLAEAGDAAPAIVFE